VSGVVGDFKKLDQLIRNLRKLGSSEWRRGLARNMGQAGLAQIEESFAGQKDPWDRPWKPSVRAEQAGGQILTKSARLRRSFTQTAQTNGFRVGTNVKYAAIHQYGGVIRARAKALRFRIGKQHVTVKAVRMPARPFIPEPELSPRWEAAFAEALEAYLEQTLQ
jgi:phage gpG-like protein